jgi:hypothetical protein
MDDVVSRNVAADGALSDPRACFDPPGGSVFSRRLRAIRSTRGLRGVRVEELSWISVGIGRSRVPLPLRFRSGAH